MKFRRARVGELKAGDSVFVEHHFGDHSCEFKVEKITPKGSVRVRYNDVATELFKPDDGEYSKASLDRITTWAHLLIRVEDTAVKETHV